MKKRRQYKSLQQLKNLEHKRWRRRLRSKKKHSGPSLSLKSPQVSAIPQPMKNSKKVTAPNDFCIKENPERVIEFINKLNDCLTKRKSCYIDLSGVTHLSPDAVVVLLSILGQFKRRQVLFNGNFPDNSEVKKQFVKLDL